MPMDVLFAEPEEAPDFRHVEHWIFDLDNTLYPASSNLFAQIDARMTAYISRLLDLPPREAKALQHAYYATYGTTLRGLTQVHHVDPDDFLADVHDIDFSVLKPDAALRCAIARLPGRRLVFTNSPSQHAERVLAHIGLTDEIDDIWDIRRLGYIPKPNPEAYERVVDYSPVAPEAAAFFEDLARNLVPAHAMGMTTVWLNNGSHWSHQGPGFSAASGAYISYEAGDLAEFLNRIRI
jgi:putative hydrolase of the HAD superfamily